TKDTWEKHTEATASYADLKHKIEGFHEATYKSNDNTDAALKKYQQNQSFQDRSQYKN
ncbi:hypothetical protein Tco_0457488, partial [Tanacetum coccineum]